MDDLIMTQRISKLKEKIHSNVRYASIEQAKIITDTYRANEDKPKIVQRALALKASLNRIKISIDPDELIVGNRTAGIRYGVVFPEGGTTWVDEEFEKLPTRAQDPFEVNQEDIIYFRENIKPYWETKSLEDVIQERYSNEINEISTVVKINQKDHAQGHICPDSKTWLAKGPQGLLEEAESYLENCPEEKKDFYKSVIITMEGAITFIERYADLANKLSNDSTIANTEERKISLIKIAENCQHISRKSPETFHEAVQLLWFLFVILQMESNASSFSPGRIDKFLYPYYKKDIDNGTITKQDALEIVESLWIKFNQIVYMRNSHSAKFFAGFPIGFNIALGGLDEKGNDFLNDISYLCLKAQEHLGMPQPNLSVRLHEKTSDEFIETAIKVVARGSGMPQFFNDKSVIPALREQGIEYADALDYAIVGCVELTTQGNNLGWSDAAMFNLNKLLELTLTGGVDLLTSKKEKYIYSDQGDLATFSNFAELESAFAKNMDRYIGLMIKACEYVESAHIEILPTAFLSSVINPCLSEGIDVTAGGAKYNLSGIQMIQVANLADSLAAIKLLVFDEKKVSGAEFLEALKSNFQGYEPLRQMILNRVPKYGNDNDYVDNLGTRWAEYFKNRLSLYKNYRGGNYHTGMYTVSAHVPMGEVVGASPDGRFAKEPLADGGMSPMYGRDLEGPTAVLKSVSKLDKNLTSNGGLLNMKFLPKFFENEESIKRFVSFLRAFVELEIPHIQFNVVNRQDLIEAQKDPDRYRSLTIRVAGYTAYFTELATALQDEIIARTSYGEF